MTKNHLKFIGAMMQILVLLIVGSFAAEITSLWWLVDILVALLVQINFHKYGSAWIVSSTAVSKNE